MYKKIEYMLSSLIDVTNCQFKEGVENVDTDEAGKVVDMIKDLSETLYYLGKYKTKYKQTDENWGKGGIAYKQLEDHMDAIEKGMPYDKTVFDNHSEAYVDGFTYDVKKLMTRMNDEAKASLKEKLTSMISRL